MAEIKDNELNIHFNEFETLKIEQATKSHKDSLVTRLNDQILANLLKEAWEVKDA